MVEVSEPQALETRIRSTKKKVKTVQIQSLYHGPRSKSSCFRGVTFYKRTKRWESHIWDLGKQIYLGASFTAHQAARSYDRAAIRFRGSRAQLNFNVSDYVDELDQLIVISKEDLVRLLRAQSIGRGSRLPDYSKVIRNPNPDKPEGQTSFQGGDQKRNAERGEVRHPLNLDKSVMDDRHPYEHFHRINQSIIHFSMSNPELVMRRQCREIISRMYNIVLQTWTPFLHDPRASTSRRRLRDLSVPKASKVSKTTKSYRNLVTHILQGSRSPDCAQH